MNSVKTETRIELSEIADREQIRERLINRIEKLLPQAAPMMGMVVPELRARILNVAVIDHMKLNSYHETWDGWGTFLYNFYYKFHLIKDEMIKLISSGIEMDEKGGITFVKENISPRFSRYTESWRSQFLNRDETAVNAFPSDELKEEQKDIARSLINLTDLFIVAHNLGHTIVRLSPSPLLESRLALTAMESSLEVFRGLVRELYDNHLSEWSTEAAADLVGLRLVTENADPKASDAGLVLVSIPIFMMIAGSLAKGRGLMIPPPFTGRRRLGFIMNFIKNDKLPFDSELYNSLESFLMESDGE